MKILLICFVWMVLISCHKQECDTARKFVDANDIPSSYINGELKFLKNNVDTIVFTPSAVTFQYHDAIDCNNSCLMSGSCAKYYAITSKKVSLHSNKSDSIIIKTDKNTDNNGYGSGLFDEVTYYFNSSLFIDRSNRYDIHSGFYDSLIVNGWVYEDVFSLYRDSSGTKADELFFWKGNLIKYWHYIPAVTYELIRK